MPHVLKVAKHEDPQQFRELLHITPYIFDKLCKKLLDNPVFFNNSNNPQIPVEEQLVVTLYRFGHNGNAAGQALVGRWAGEAKGASALHTKRVMTAVLQPSVMKAAIRMPTPGEKAWVAAHSCKAWRHGWLFIDGTLIPLFDCPH